MTKIYREKDASLDPLNGKTIAVIGYGNQGHAQANNMRDRGCDIIIGVRPDGFSWNRAEEDGFDVYEIEEAVAKGDIVHFLIPDEVQPKVYEKKLKQKIGEKEAICFSHGFNVHFGVIETPDDIDVIMIAPKCPGPMFRRAFEKGSAVPGLIAVENNSSGQAKETALAMAKATGMTRVGVQYLRRYF